MLHVAFHRPCASTATVCTSPIYLSRKTVSLIASPARSGGHVGTRVDTKCGH
jgi:hypothetical protein